MWRARFSKSLRGANKLEVLGGKFQRRDGVRGTRRIPDSDQGTLSAKHLEVAQEADIYSALSHFLMRAIYSRILPDAIEYSVYALAIGDLQCTLHRVLLVV